MMEWQRRNPDGSLTVGILSDVPVETVEKPVEKAEEVADKPKKKTTKKK